VTSRTSTIRSLALAGTLAVALQLAAPIAARAATGSTLTLDATPTTATVGDQIGLSGQLTFADASSSEGQTITLTREDAAGSTPLPDAVTDVNGNYSATDTVDVGGTVTYQASFAGTTASLSPCTMRPEDGQGARKEKS